METAILVHQREQNLSAGQLRGCYISQNSVIAIVIASHLRDCILLHGEQHIAIGTIHATEGHGASPRRRQNVTRSSFSMEATAILLIAIRCVQMNATIAIAGAIQRYPTGVISRVIPSVAVSIVITISVSVSIAVAFAIVAASRLKLS